MMQSKAWTAFGDSTLASAIYYCLNFQQGLNKDENPRPELILPTDIFDIPGESSIIDVSCDYGTKNEDSYLFRNESSCCIC